MTMKDDFLQAEAMAAVLSLMAGALTGGR